MPAHQGYFLVGGEVFFSGQASLVPVRQRNRKLLYSAVLRYPSPFDVGITSMKLRST